MSLLSRLREKRASKIATATPATFATDEWINERTVASVATVTVATFPQGQQTALSATVRVGDIPTASRTSLFCFSDHNPVAVDCHPDVFPMEGLESQLDVVAVEPFTPIVQQAAVALFAGEELGLASISEMMGQSNWDAEAWGSFLGQTSFKKSTQNRRSREDLGDDLRTCRQCLNLMGRVCRVAQPGGRVSANRGYTPQPDLPIRCAGYLPGIVDPDQRPGILRWPGLGALCRNLPADSAIEG